jgi:hypothetical protein
LLRFALKTPKNCRSGDFYPANSESTPVNRDFCVTIDAKIHKCNRLLEDKIPNHPQGGKANNRAE